MRPNRSAGVVRHPREVGRSAASATTFVFITTTTACRLVALASVRAIEPYSRGEHRVRLIDGTTIPMSRRLRGRVRSLLEGRPC